MLPKEVVLLSGPGCPVCVTPEAYIDAAMEILNLEDVILVTFGDMMKVKGTCLSLSEKLAQGSEIIVAYSPEDALTVAAKNTDKQIVFIAVGFETTAPLIAATVKLAKERGLDNLFFLTALKRIEPAIRFILQDERNKINAMICPGHVASIIGAEHFRFIMDEFDIPAVVCGFENQDITAGICLLLEQLTGKRHKEFVNLYKRCVGSTGNTVAQQMIDEVFDVADGEWRGIGPISNSALVWNINHGQDDSQSVRSISFYQIITPSAWNLSTRSNSDVKGTAEQALIGTPIRDINNPIEIGRIIRSFDPCISCATHVYSGGKHINTIQTVPF